MADVNAIRVLAVDDEEGIRELLRRMLEPAGYLVQTAPDAEHALAMVRTFQPHVLLIDVHMPGRDGLWLADQVRQIAPRSAMVLATFDADIPPTASLKPGIVEYLVKPFDQAAVLKAVEAAVEWAEQVSGQVAPPHYSAPVASVGGAPHARSGPRPAFWVMVALGLLLLWGIYRSLS